MKASLTFDEATQQYLATKLDELSSEKHRKQWRSVLANYASPVLGPMHVKDITVQDVLRTIEPIWREKTETASRLRSRIESVLSWATVAGHRTGDNPARWKGNLSELLPKPNKVATKRHQPAIDLSDLPGWWSDLGRREGMAAEALRFLTLTAARSGEVRGATWDEVDLSPKRAVWTVPASRMKNGREHRVPLSRDAVDLLAALPRLRGSPYVFFVARGGMLSDMSVSTVMRRMQEAAEGAGLSGYVDPRSGRPSVPHGLRSTFRQWTAERGYQRDMAEIALAHFIGTDVERACQRSDMLERRREMMEDCAATLRAEAGTDQVISLQGARS